MLNVINRLWQGLFEWLLWLLLPELVGVGVGGGWPQCDLPPGATSVPHAATCRHSTRLHNGLPGNTATLLQLQRMLYGEERDTTPMGNHME